MALRPGVIVRHPVYGIGRVIEVLGEECVVNFFGELIKVLSTMLEVQRQQTPEVQIGAVDEGRVSFRRAYEAVNLGVVPPNPDQLLKSSIGGDRLIENVRGWLANAGRDGLCKVVFGDYGTGKSHHLRVIQAAALQEGWIVSFVEFDPKQADPAKPHLVYRSIVEALRFPKRVDGSQSRNFYDLVGEVRSTWDVVRTGRMFQESPWFEDALNVLRCHSHEENPEYLDGINWLAGQVFQHNAIKSLARQNGGRCKAPPRMPRTLETAEVYVQHLAVLNEWAKALGYKGLLIVLDEAEHVRSFNVNRRDRATNFFDLLARGAHLPAKGLPEPHRNEHDFVVPAFWKRGPHFGVVVALTEGQTFSDPEQDFRDACVFLHSEEDIVRLSAPSPEDYRRWCSELLTDFARAYPGQSEPLQQSSARDELATLLAEEYARQRVAERTLRIWVKAGTLIPSLFLAGRVESVDTLGEIVRSAARQATGELKPWEI